MPHISSNLIDHRSVLAGDALGLGRLGHRKEGSNYCISN